MYGCPPKLAASLTSVWGQLLRVAEGSEASQTFWKLPWSSCWDRDPADPQSGLVPRQTKPKKGQFMNFSQGHSGTKVRYVNFVLVFLRKNTPEFTQKWAKFMNFSFWPFLWFGLPGRLLTPNRAPKWQIWATPFLGPKNGLLGGASWSHLKKIALPGY